jgi:hypothetical protein
MMNVRGFKRMMALVGAAVLTLFLGMSSPAQADTWYIGSGSNGAAGMLYTVDPATGVATLVGPMVGPTGTVYNVTGLAFHPDGRLFGATANIGGTRDRLIQINPATGQVIMDFGGFGTPSTLSDITIAPGGPAAGTAYGWTAAGTHSTYTVPLASPPTAVLIGLSGVGGGFGGGSLASDLNGVLWASPNAVVAGGAPIRSFGTVNTMTGVFTSLGQHPIAQLPAGFAINGLDFDSSNQAHGIRSNRGFPALTDLVDISTTAGTIGAISNIRPIVTAAGARVGDIDALAILRTPVGAPIPEPSTCVLFSLGFVGLLGYVWRRRVAYTPRGPK